MYRKNIEHLYHAFMYSPVSLLLDIVVIPQSNGHKVQFIRPESCLITNPQHFYTDIPPLIH